MSDSSPTRDLHRLYVYTLLTLLTMGVSIAAMTVVWVALSDVSLVTAVIAGTAATISAGCALASYVIFLHNGPRRGQLRLWVAALVMFAIGYAACGFDGRVDANWVLLMGFLAAGPLFWVKLSSRPGTIAAITGVAAAVSYGSYQLGLVEAHSSILVSTVLTPFLGWGIWSQWWNYDVAVQSEDARRVAAQLAVADERLRFAAELHDIQGHHLQAITLKAELAARLSETTGHSSTEALREIERLARQALQDTRDVVTGYRTVSLEMEIDNAAQVLKAAGIEATVVIAAGSRTASVSLLGYLVREAATNILRHARASWAELKVEQHEATVTVTVTNDQGGAGPVVAGNGLTMLAERFATAGGTLEWDLTEGRFSITGSVRINAEETTR
ncbi:sensor histidine kinase [Natronoglycomyces albus]|uniref:Signal transduction histidine kinase subgroup 3 dimerisation and phosphoacceptor domain-containing protein n=1 Tax=Natronoglycomyces albus TaxID=2811108 RepID=A0A895XWW1_9ACTN|nr:histidine kinase [Natronoglycomyces albus]QSB06710.1 hypothetical protein JQS30_07400 [Natronoglycomyces albus]